MENPRPEGLDFIRARIAEELASGRQDTVVTRFPPEPNGYLHLGHAKSICLNFGLAAEHGSRCHLRYDDTNPLREDAEFVRAIADDIRWLGFDPGQHVYFASDYFAQLYEYAEILIRKGLAYVCDLSADDMRAYRGTLTEPGRPSPWRDRAATENLDLFRRMRAGAFPDGSRTLRAKIDMASGNVNMRDPVLYRIRHERHHRTGDRWCIYPTYDYTHPLSDAIEHITHSICTLEFEDHRPLYDWLIAVLPVPARPQQIEFARLNLTYTVLSKRFLTELVQSGRVDGWDDPRMPTLAGLRRRGVPPAALREFAARIGVSKANSTTDVELLWFCVREELNRTAPRAMAVLDPLKVTVTNLPADHEEWCEFEINPENASAGKRRVAFTPQFFIEREDFAETPAKKWFRLAPGAEVRLKHAYYFTCTDVVKDGNGRVVELRGTVDPASRGGWTQDGRKVKGTLHWVSAVHGRDAQVRLFEPLFAVAEPGKDGRSLLADMNPASMTVVDGAKIEPSLCDAQPGVALQFLRQGYFAPDPRLHTRDKPVFHRVVGLRDSWAKEAKK